MSAPEHLRFRATVSDAYDGASRLLCDMRRLGLSLNEFHIVSRVQDLDVADISCSIVLTPGMTGQNVCAKLGRHPVVLSLNPASECNNST